MTALLVVCRDPISRLALTELAVDVACTDPAHAVAAVRAAPPAAILVDADEPGSAMLIAALSLAAVAPILAFATGTVDHAAMVRAGARIVLHKPTGRTVLPGDPALALWRDTIGDAI